jgi:hypothetical protein
VLGFLWVSPVFFFKQMVSFYMRNCRLLCLL